MSIISYPFDLYSFQASSTGLFISLLKNWIIDITRITLYHNKNTTVKSSKFTLSLTFIYALPFKYFAIAFFLEHSGYFANAIQVMIKLFNFLQFHKKTLTSRLTPILFISPFSRELIGNITMLLKFSH